MLDVAGHGVIPCHMSIVPGGCFPAGQMDWGSSMEVGSEGGEEGSGEGRGLKSLMLETCWKAALAITQGSSPAPPAHSQTLP